MANITYSLAVLGNPAKTFVENNVVGANPPRGTWKPVARTVWDLKAFNDVLYLGCGDLEANVGPCPVLTYTPATGAFGGTAQGTPQWYTEQVERFCLAGGTLIVPFSDPGGLGDGLFRMIRLESGTWVLRGSGPSDTAHFFSIDQFNSRWIASPMKGFHTLYSAPVTANADSGLDSGWEAALAVLDIGETIQAIWQFNGKVFIDRAILRVVVSPNVVRDGMLTSTTGASLSWDVVIPPGNTRGDFAALFPPPYLTLPNVGKIWRPVIFAGKVVYIGADALLNYWYMPFALYTMANDYTITNIYNAAKPTTGTNHRVWDLRVVGVTLYALWSHTAATGDIVVTLRKTTDLSTWSDEWWFLPNYVPGTAGGQSHAHSFEFLGTKLYIGLGTTVTSSAGPANSGELLVYDTAQVAVPGPPTVVTVAAVGNARATWSWVMPANNGGAAIDDYRVSVYRVSDDVLVTQAQTNSAATTLETAGLANLVAVYAKVEAHNSTGWSTQSAASSSATPYSVRRPPGMAGGIPTLGGGI